MTNAADLAADYKHRGMDKCRAWDQYIIDCGLKPEMNAKDFYAIYENSSPRALITYNLPNDYKPTHFDTLYQMDCQIKTDMQGVRYITWENGHTGSNPPCYPEAERYIEKVKG